MKQGSSSITKLKNVVYRSCYDLSHFVKFEASEESIKYNYTTQKYERNDFVGWLFTCPENGDSCPDYQV